MKIQIKIKILNLDVFVTKMDSSSKNYGLNYLEQKKKNFSRQILIDHENNIYVIWNTKKFILNFK